MFVSIRRKYFQLVVISCLLFAVAVSLLLTMNERSRAKLNERLNLNYFDKLSGVIYNSYFSKKYNDDSEVFDPESQFNKQVDTLRDQKMKADEEENELWIIDSKIKQNALNVPSYYYEQTEKPPIQPFDVRFTLGVYFHHLRQSAKRNPTKMVEAPFHWYDWVDMSVMNQYLLAPAKEKPSCAMLDARQDEEKMNSDAASNRKAKEAEEEKNKQKLEEENRKKQEEENKRIAEEKKKTEEEKKKTEEEKKKTEEEKKKTEDEKDNTTGEKSNENEEQLKSPEQANKANKNEENKEANEQEKIEQNRPAKREAKPEALDPKDYCIDDAQLPADFRDGNKLHPGFNVFKSSIKTTPDKAILVGKSYLYSHAPPPSMIIFLTKDGSYNITTTKREKLLDSDLVGNYISQSKKTSIDPLTEFKSLRKSVKANTHQSINKYEINLSQDSFIFEYEKIIEDYQTRMNNGEKLPPRDLDYLQSLQYSRDSVMNGGPPKYFTEARLLGSLIGDHYDWRFFNGVIYNASQRTLILHRLIRSWLSFSRKNGINTWVAHGSLLSWYWNGFAFPWDNDIDVQVPIMDLHKLSLQFNETLIVEDSDEGYGRYFMDCGSFITLRAKGNGNNNIDARFIDIDSGIYIDITGLAVSNSKPPPRYKELYPEHWVDEASDFTKLNTDIKAYNCRNNHFSTLEELSPLVKTYVEGELAYVPRKYSDILTVEYSKGLLNRKYGGHIFVPQLRLWIKEEDLHYFLHDREKWKGHNYNAEYTNIGSIEDLEKANVRFELTEAQKSDLLQAAQDRKNLGQQKTGATKLNDKDLHSIYNFKKEELLELLTKDEHFMNYYSTRDFTFFHEEEVMRLLFGKPTEKLLNTQKPFRPFKTNIFDYNYHNNQLNYDDEVHRYIALSIAYLNAAKGNGET